MLETTMPTPRPIALVAPAPSLPDLEEAAFRWSGAEVQAFDAACAAHAALIESQPYERHVEEWRGFFRARTQQADGAKAKGWFREFMAELKLPAGYPQTFAAGRPEREEVLIRGARVVLRAKEHDTLGKMVQAIWAAVAAKNPPMRAREVVVPDGVTRRVSAAGIPYEEMTIEKLEAEEAPIEDREVFLAFAKVA